MRLLTVLWTLPAVGALVALGLGRLSRHAARNIALFASLAVLVVSIALAYFPWASLAETSSPCAFGIRYSLALDGLSLPLCWLTAFLTVIVLIASWTQDVPPGYWAAFLFLESALFGVFLARDLFLFYIFWEAVLIPMFFIIGLWGSDNRRHAAMKFFLFTFFGSIFLLLGLLLLVTKHHQATGIWTWDLEALQGPHSRAGVVIFAAMVLGFGVKIPIVPLHTWLPDAHTEAPAAGSVMLAGVMLKMGIYGFLRVAFPLFPELSWLLMPWLGAIAAINIVYGALCAMAQVDIKRLVAYSSVAHLGFCMLGALSRTPEGLAGASLQMINHGLSTGALFLLIGFMYQRAHRRGISDFGDLASRAPWLTFFFCFAMLASIGLPGLNGFVGEFLSLAGMMRALPIFAVVGVVGVTLSAAYLLPAFQSIFWADPGPHSVSAHVSDLDRREKTLLWALCVPMLVIGLYPKPLLDMFTAALGRLVQ